ncbi:MAG: glycosyltransferase family 87 protein [Polyangiales bacterium]
MSDGSLWSRLRRRWAFVPVWVALGVHLLCVAQLLGQPISRDGQTTKPFLLHALYFDATHRVGPGADFFALYRAARQLDYGRGAYDAYDLPQSPPYAYPYRYLPVVADTLGRVFLGLSPDSAYRVWILLLEFTYLAVFWVLMRRLRPTPWRIPAACILLLATPWFLEVHMGQFTFLCVALCLGAAWSFEKSATHMPWRHILAHLSLATGVMLKLFPAVVLPAFFVRGNAPRRAAFVVAALLAAAFALSFANDIGAWGFFRRTNLSTRELRLDSGNQGFFYAAYASIQALGFRPSRLAWDIGLKVWQVSAFALSSLLVWRFGKARLVSAICVLLTTHFVTYHHVWEHHYSAVIALALAFIAELWQQPQMQPHRRNELAAVALLCAALLALPTPYALFDVASAHHVWDPGVRWPLWKRALLPCFKAIPAFALQVTLWSSLIPSRSDASQPSGDFAFTHIGHQGPGLHTHECRER